MTTALRNTWAFERKCFSRGKCKITTSAGNGQNGGCRVYLTEHQKKDFSGEKRACKLWFILLYLMSTLQIKSKQIYVVKCKIWKDLLCALAIYCCFRSTRTHHTFLFTQQISSRLRTADSRTVLYECALASVPEPDPAWHHIRRAWKWRQLGGAFSPMPFTPTTLPHSRPKHTFFQARGKYG